MEIPNGGVVSSQGHKLPIITDKMSLMLGSPLRYYIMTAAAWSKGRIGHPQADLDFCSWFHYNERRRMVTGYEAILVPAEASNF